MTSASVVEILSSANPGAKVYGVIATGEVVIERRNGKKRGRAHITVLSHHEAEREASRLMPEPKAVGSQQALADFLSIVNWGAELQAEVEESLSKFFEMQQMCWLHLEENAEVKVLNGVEDITNSNSGPEQYYPIVGTDLGVSDVAETKEEVVNPVEVITELKQEVARARVIEFRAGGKTYTRQVRKADKAAFAAIKADIRTRVATLWPAEVVDEALRRIIPTVKVRPGFVYVSAA